MRLPIRMLLLLLSSMLLCSAAGCGSEEMSNPKGALEDIAGKYWNSRLIDKDYKSTYDMEMIEEDSLDYQDYEKRVKSAGHIGFYKLWVEEVAVEGDKGQLMVKGEVQLPGAPIPVTSSMPDEWVIHENEWKHVLKK